MCQAPPVAATIDATWNASQYPNRFDAVRGVFEVYWAVDAARQNVDFAIRVLGFWASFGPARTSSGLMISSDPMMAYFDGNGAPVIEDQFAVSLSAPVADVNRGGQASFSALAGAANATGMTIKWRRALNTNDVATDNPISATGSTSFVLAWGSSAAPSYHGAQRAAVLIDVVGGGATVTASSDPLKIAHGSLMAIAFGLAMSVGIVIALVVPKDKTWWFPAHWILQAIATVLVFVAFAIILAWYSQSGNTHFRTNSVTMGSHAIIGIIVVVLVLWQVFICFLVFLLSNSLPPGHSRNCRGSCLAERAQENRSVSRHQSVSGQGALVARSRSAGGRMHQHLLGHRRNGIWLAVLRRMGRDLRGSCCFVCHRIHLLLQVPETKGKLCSDHARSDERILIKEFSC